MGDMLVAVCPCGYESKMVRSGCGFVVHSGLAPALCRTCHEYVTVDPSRARVRCATCRRKPEVLQAFVAGEGPSESQAFECPACGKFTAVFQNCGIWD